MIASQHIILSRGEGQCCVTVLLWRGNVYSPQTGNKQTKVSSSIKVNLMDQWVYQVTYRTLDEGITCRTLSNSMAVTSPEAYRTWGMTHKSWPWHSNNCPAGGRISSLQLPWSVFSLSSHFLLQSLGEGLWGVLSGSTASDIETLFAPWDSWVPIASEKECSNSEQTAKQHQSSSNTKKIWREGEWFSPESIIRHSMR